MSISICIYALLSIVNIFNGTGLDYVFHVTDWTKLIIVFLTIFFILINRKSSIDKSGVALCIVMAIDFGLVSFFKGYDSVGIKYMWFFALVYFLSMFEIDNEDIKKISLIYGGFGIIVLILYGFTSIFHGWNSNSIAMLGMHSYLILGVRYFQTGSKRDYIVFLALSLVYMYLLNFTYSRSCLLIIAGSICLILLHFKSKLLVKTGFRRILILLFPLFVVWLTVTVSSTDFYASLNMWSISTAQKTIFNGRDTIWSMGLEVIKNNFFFGTGSLNYFNWHNSAIVCLVGYGVIGYCLWLGSFQRLLRNISFFAEDEIVSGALGAFLLAYVQKSVELGLIAESPDMLMYIMLGIAFGRIKYIMKHQNSIDMNRRIEKKRYEY